MPKSIDGITYTDDISSIMKDKLLGPAFREFVKSRYAGENVDFIDDSKKMQTRTHFKKYFSTKSKTSINISGDLREKIYKLHNAVLYKDKKAWAEVYRQARSEIITLLDSNFLTDFWKSDHFRTIHDATLAKQQARQLAKIPKQMLGDMGAKNPAELAPILTMMKASKSAGLKEAEKFAKKRRSSMDAKAITAALGKL